MIVCAYDTRNTNISHLLIAAGVGVAQQSSWDPSDCRIEWKYEVTCLQQEQACVPHLFPYNALDHERYSKCQMLNNLLGPKGL